LKIAIVDSDRIQAEATAFSAARRGHQAVCLTTLDDLETSLPFSPHIVIVNVAATREDQGNWVSGVLAAFPEADVIATVEKPEDSLPARLFKDGVRDVIRLPYNPAEVILSAEATQARRPGPPANVAAVADLEVAVDDHRATKNGADLDLTNLELRLLFCLCEHYPNVTPIDRLLTFGWQSLDEPSPGLLKTHISHIRRKLDLCGGVVLSIKSRQSVGYLLSVLSPGDVDD
jgi:DNA-binding response OmpR family regulator